MSRYIIIVLARLCTLSVLAFLGILSLCSHICVHYQSVSISGYIWALITISYISTERICCTSAKSPVAIVEGPYLFKLAFQSKRLVEDGLAKECVYSHTSHGSSTHSTSMPQGMPSSARKGFLVTRRSSLIV